ncbi:MAG: T9SS type A sorting domain-containing protein [Candidatus Zixiibacteriota bacterium]|nr:MAG: T9SS type A sorting domain-containing protein [candidate division Zixibacteria bacterium]
MRYVNRQFAIVTWSGLLIFAASVFGMAPTAANRAQIHHERIFFPADDTEPSFGTGLSIEQIDDFDVTKISETVAPATFAQTHSSIAVLAGDKSVVVWQDNRHGAYKIYAQVFDAQGGAISGNGLVVGRDDGYDLIEPKVVGDGSGGFYLAWRDVHSARIYAARYDDDLNEIAAPFVASGTASGSSAGPFDIDAYPDGRLVVVWEEYNAGIFIGLCIYSPTGMPLLGTVIVNTDGGDARHWVPSVAIDTSGAMVVVWEDYRFGNADIFMQRVSVGGTLVGGNLGVVDAAFDGVDQYLPVIAYSPRDGYAISWIDTRGGDNDIFIQRFVPGTGLVDGNVEISPEGDVSQDWDIDMTVNSSGDLVLVWASVNSLNRILLQRFAAGYEPLNTPLQINLFTDGSRWGTAVGVRPDNRILASWTDYRFNHPDIFLQYLTSSGNHLYAQDRLVNDDTEGANSIEPDLALIDGATAVAVFTDQRFDNGDVFMQLVGIGGGLIGGNIRVNDDTLKLLQSEPAVATAADKILVVWNDTRAIAGSTGSRIFGQYADGGGSFAGSNFAVSDSDNVFPKSTPVTAMASDGTAMVAWREFYDDEWHIFGRFFHVNNVPMGDAYAISIPGSDFDNSNVGVHVDNSDIFTVAWLAKDATGEPFAHVARFSKTGTSIGSFEFTSDISGAVMTDLASAVDNMGNVYLFWQGTDTEEHLFLTVFTPDGIIKKTSFEIPDEFAVNPGQPDVAIDGEGVALMTWIDSRFGPRAGYYQIIAQNFHRIGANGALVSEMPELMNSPVAAGLNRNGWFAWSDPRADGFNIYLHQFPYSTTGVDDDDPDVIPDCFALRQNYPNPFNPSTVIEFSLPIKSRVVITVTDILGREVATVADKVFSAGSHRVTWHGRDRAGAVLPSGMYLYRMKTEQHEFSRKMLLLK